MNYYNCTFDNETYFNSTEPCDDGNMTIEDLAQMFIFTFFIFGILWFLLCPTYRCCCRYHQYRTMRREVRIVQIVQPTYSDYIISIEAIEEEICVICLDDLRNEEKTGKLENCEHIFHKKCIKKWLEENPICPVCRTGII